MKRGLLHLGIDEKSEDTEKSGSFTLRTQSFPEILKLPRFLCVLDDSVLFLYDV